MILFMVSAQRDLSRTQFSSEPESLTAISRPNKCARVLGLLAGSRVGLDTARVEFYPYFIVWNIFHVRSAAYRLDWFRIMAGLSRVACWSTNFSKQWEEWVHKVVPVTKVSIKRLLGCFTGLPIPERCPKSDVATFKKPPGCSVSFWIPSNWSNSVVGTLEEPPGCLVVLDGWERCALYIR